MAAFSDVPFPLCGVLDSAPGEDDLLGRLRAGDAQEFTRLVQAHHASLVRVAQAFVGSHALAEEVAQDTWRSVLEHLRGFERRSSLRTWIFRICSNKAKTRASRESRTTPLSALSALERDDEGPTVDPGRFDARRRWSEPPARFGEQSPERIAVNAQAMRRLREVIETLPPAQRAVITLRDGQGFDAGETCNVLEISESNQRVLLHRARSKVRQALEDVFGDAERR